MGAVRQLSALRKLDIRDCKLREPAVRALAEALPDVAATLEELDMSSGVDKKVRERSMLAFCDA